MGNRLLVWQPGVLGFCLLLVALTVVNSLMLEPFLQRWFKGPGGVQAEITELEWLALEMNVKALNNPVYRDRPRHTYLPGGRFDQLLVLIDADEGTPEYESLKKFVEIDLTTVTVNRPWLQTRIEPTSKAAARVRARS